MNRTIEKPLFDRQYLIKLILPLIAEQFLAMTIGAVDTMMVSSIGDAGVSGVSLVDQLSQLVIQLFAAFATGGAVVASQYIGHKKEDSARRAAKQLVTISAMAALFLIVICIPFRKVILNVFFGKSGQEILMNCSIYFFWILISFPFLAVYNSSAALFRAMGNSRISLFVSLIMNLVNIGGNALLIYGAKIGVAGAGISTLASRIFAAGVMMILLCRKNKNIIYIEKIWKPEFDFGMIKRILKIAIPSGIENSVFHIGKLIVFSLMSGFGQIAISANAISNSIASFANIPSQAIGLASVTIIGHCIGADEKDQAMYYGKKLLKEAYMGMLLTASLIFAASPFIVNLFKIARESQILASGVIRTCMIANLFFWPMSFTMPNILRAAGDAKYTMIISNISMWAFRVLFSFLISKILLARYPENPSLALYGIWFGMYLDWIFRGVFFWIRFKSGRWLEKRVI